MGLTESKPEITEHDVGDTNRLTEQLGNPDLTAERRAHVVRLLERQEQRNRLIRENRILIDYSYIESNGQETKVEYEVILTSNQLLTGNGPELINAFFADNEFRTFFDNLIRRFEFNNAKIKAIVWSVIPQINEHDNNAAYPINNPRMLMLFMFCRELRTRYPYMTHHDIPVELFATFGLPRRYAANLYKDVRDNLLCLDFLYKRVVRLDES
jgi:hypothetical protein